MRLKKRMTQNTLVWTAIIGSLLIMVMVSFNAIWASKQIIADTEEAVSSVSTFYLETMAERRAKTITNLINENFEEMEKAIAFIKDEKISSQEELRDSIGKVEALLALDRFALVDEKDIVYTQYTTYTGKSRHPFLSEKKIKDRTMSTVSLYGSSKLLCLAIPTSDLSIMGKPFKACFVQVDIKDIAELLAFDHEDKTHFALYSKTGANLTGTELGSVISSHNLFDVLKDLIPEDVWKEHYQNFANGAPGTITFVYGGTDETLCYVPVQGTGWEMAVLIREKVIQEQIRDVSENSLRISRNQIAFTLAAMLVLACVLLFEVRTLTLDKLAAEKAAAEAYRNMANTDSLTGIRNKNAYTEHETVINRRIKEGKIEKLSLVVCDINGLKHVNDTRGHAAGDQLIKDACTLVSGYFSHGRIFRVGGDEFVVLLVGEDCDTMPEVVNELNRKVEANIAEGDVVVSVGYAVFDHADQQLRDVFERADQMMYERKKELKRLGAVTSRL